MAYHHEHPIPTIKPFAGFDAKADAEVLHKAMKGIGCNSPAVINVLCKRSRAQRQQILTMFKTMYGKDLIAELKSELGGHLEDIIVALFYKSDEYDAMKLRKAMSGAGTDEATIIEIMCTRTNEEIRAIQAAYKKLYNKDLEHDLKGETSGHFKRLLVALCAAGRDESYAQDEAKAKVDAKALLDAGEKKWGTDESQFNAILCSQNQMQLQLVFEAYRKLTGHEIEVAIEKEFSGDIKNGFLAIVKTMKNRPGFFAERLYYSMKGAGTDDDTLIRIVVTRCEVDMVQIKYEFQRVFEKSLESFISGDTSGSYKEALIALVKGN